MSDDVDSTVTEQGDGEAEVRASSANASSEADELAKQLRSERLIKIYVGNAIEPYLVQQTLLEHTSQYFTKAIRNEHLGGPQNIGTLRFPEDDEETWRLILFWIFKGKIPVSIRRDARSYKVEEFQRIYALLVKCWAAGDRYFMNDFQNSAMMHLLFLLETATIFCKEAEPLSWTNIKLAFEVSAPESQMRKFAAMNVVHALYRSDLRYKVDPDGQHQLDFLVGVPGASWDLLMARDSFSIPDPFEEGASTNRKYFTTSGASSARQVCFKKGNEGRVTRSWSSMDATFTLALKDKAKDAALW